jgi:hypothetical protein
MDPVSLRSEKTSSIDLNFPMLARIEHKSLEIFDRSGRKNGAAAGHRFLDERDLCGLVLIDLRRMSMLILQ